MHSFALTERYAVLVAFPLRGQPARACAAFGPALHRELPLEAGLEHDAVLVFDREDGALRGHV